MIYALTNSKGGVSKTTNSVHLAAALARTSPTLLIDGDPQSSSAIWAARRRENGSNNPSPVTTRLLGKALLDEGRKLSQGFENTVVDAGGRDSADLRSALLLADVAIIPLGASNVDTDAMADFLEVVNMAMDYNPNLRIKVLLARIDTRTKDTGEVIEFLQEQSLPRLSSIIYERVAFRRVMPFGSTVAEYKRDKAAIAEIEAFVGEVTAK